MQSTRISLETTGTWIRLLACRGAALAMLATVSTLPLVGCERKEKVIDIKTPDVDIEVERSNDSHDIEIRRKERDADDNRDSPE